MDADLDRRVLRCGRCLHQLVVEQCLPVAQEQRQSMDEQIIPFEQKQPLSVFAQETETLGLQDPCKVLCSHWIYP